MVDEFSDRHSFQELGQIPEGNYGQAFSNGRWSAAILNDVDRGTYPRRDRAHSNDVTRYCERELQDVRYHVAQSS